MGNTSTKDNKLEQPAYFLGCNVVHIYDTTGNERVCYLLIIISQCVYLCLLHLELNDDDDDNWIISTSLWNRSVLILNVVTMYDCEHKTENCHGANFVVSGGTAWRQIWHHSKSRFPVRS